MTSTLLITTDSTVGDAITRSPSAISVFHDLGIDACSGGDTTLADAAASAGVDLITLFTTLASEAELD